MKSLINLVSLHIPRIILFKTDLWRPNPIAGYTPVMQRFLPLDEKWKETLKQIQWLTKLPPQIAGGSMPTYLEDESHLKI